MDDRQLDVLERCRTAFTAWRTVRDDRFSFAPPKGFSTFTMAVECRDPAEPPAVLYRHLEGKENAILDAADERRIYELLSDEGVAAQCLAYESTHRIEAFYRGRTLTRHDLRDHTVLQKIGAQLARLHALSPSLPDEMFFARLRRRWGPLARETLTTHRHVFPPHEQAMCDELLGLLSDDTARRVASVVPRDARVGFCHNDTYHGNVMLLDSGDVRLLDFEFACRNVRAFDFSNLFAETVTRHGLADEPYFDIAEPEYGVDDIHAVVDGYLAAGGEGDADVLVRHTRQLIPLSDYMYAMAALPLAVEPVQKIRFIPYALRRFRRFQAATEPSSSGVRSHER